MNEWKKWFVGSKVNVLRRSKKYLLPRLDHLINRNVEMNIDQFSNVIKCGYAPN